MILSKLSLTLYFMFNVCLSCACESRTCKNCVTFAQFTTGKSLTWVDLQLYSPSGPTNFVTGVYTIHDLLIVLSKEIVSSGKVMNNLSLTLLNAVLLKEGYFDFLCYLSIHATLSKEMCLVIGYICALTNCEKVADLKILHVVDLLVTILRI